MTRKWFRRERNGYIDPVQAFRQARLRKAHDERPSRRRIPPYRLADHDQPTHLHPTFVRYLDGRTERDEWELLYRELLHRDLQWWADRYEEACS